MQMDSKKKLTLMIHDLTPWGGQDRSVLEIAYNLNKKFPLEIHSYSLEGRSNWPQMEHVKYELKIKKPIIIKYLHYYLKSKQNLSTLDSNDNRIIQSTGTASLISDVVQVQFLHNSWNIKQKKLALDDATTSSGLLRDLYHRGLNKFKIKMENKLYTKKKQYIAISHGIKKELTEHFQIPANNIQVIHHGVDPDVFCPYNEHPKGPETRKKIREEHGISDDKIVLLHVGALNYRKGLHASLKTLSYLKKEGFNNLHYLAVGQGNTKKLKAFCKELDITDMVSFVSHSKDIRTYYWAADIFFFPSLYEPFGLVILEAMSCGLATFATYDSGAAELIEQNISGVIIEKPTSPKYLAKILDSKIKSPNTIKEMGAEARKVALSQSWKEVSKRYQEFYERLFNKIH